VKCKNRNEDFNMQRNESVELSAIDSVLNQLHNYPENELYRLVVDGRLHAKETGWLGYEEREAGSLKAMFNGLGYALTNLSDTQLTVDYIQKLHRICTTNVKNLFNNGRPGILRSHPIKDIVGFPLNPARTTIEGVTALLDKIEAQSEYPKYHSAWFIKNTGMTIGGVLQKPSKLPDNKLINFSS
jgi:hypothetical protein